MLHSNRIKILLLTLGLLVLANDAFAGSSTTYYAELVTKVSSNSPTGSGLVYAGTETVKPSDTTYDDKEQNYKQGDADSSGKDTTFYAYARANKGYIFNGWTKTDNSTDYLSTDSIYIVKIKCSTEKNGTNTETYYAVFGYDSITITYTAPTNGTYKATYTYSDTTITMSPGSETQQKTSAETITLTATPNTDYKFVCFTKEVGNVKSTLSIKTPYTFAPTEDAIVYAEFVSKTQLVFSVDGELYFDLNEANTAALSSVTKTIIVVQDGILPAGNYTISSGITLLVPYSNDFTVNTNSPSRSSNNTYKTPEPFIKLTLSDGAIINLEGSICVNAQQGAASGGSGNSAGGVNGPYGQIIMNTGSKITLNNNSNLYCWGYITGDGIIDALSGSKVYESFQFTDFRGGTALLSLYNNKNKQKVFPLNQYFIQNIECYLRYHKGTEEFLSTAVYAAYSTQKSDNMPFIGTNKGLFQLVGEDALATRKYDPQLDRINYSILGTAKLGVIDVTVYGTTLSSKDYVCPITFNMSINLLNGASFAIDKEISFLPGAEVEVEEGASLTIEESGILYVYDSDEWNSAFLYPHSKVNPVYSPTKTFNRTIANSLKDAKLLVNGTVNLNGGLYTTTNGADICSTGKGKINFNSNAVTDAITYQATQSSSSISYSEISVTPAQLKNADASYLSTAGVSANTTINYRNGHWGWLTKWLDYDGTTQLYQETGINQKELTDYTYTGTIPSDKELIWEIATDEDNQEVTYTAKLITPEGPALDIVSWTADSLTINATGFTLSGWPYTINGVSYGRENATTSPKCKADRTVTIPYTGKPDEQLQIQVKNKDGNTYSFHAYTIPHIYTNDATLSDTKSTSTVFVNAGNLTINTATTLAAIYLSPSAQLTVSSPLTVGNLYLRTTAWNAAVLQNNSTITADHAYYTRIVADKNRYFQFAIPLSSNTKEVTLSNGLSCPYGKAWLLKSYSESLRANQGITNTETASNWVLLDSTEGTITGTTGYELYSNSAYYREFYFPVTLPASPATQVPVSCTNGAAGALHAGWNALCSPLLGAYKQTFSDPSEAIKVSKLMPSGRYQQYIPETIFPAVPFYYQAPKSGNLDFSGKELTQKAPLREWQVKVATQWLRLVLSDAEGLMLDETNIFIHPDKFTVDYESGYDVTKLSLQGEKALLYSELPCGALAFAAVPDSLAQTLIPITVYADKDETCTFHLTDNAYRTRLSNVFLRDTETDALIDLTTGDYQTAINKGTTRGRFYITCVFSDEQDINDRLDNTLYNNSDEEVRKILYNDQIYILRNGSIYDITGRRCEIK